MIPFLINQITNDTQIIHYYGNPSDSSEINKIIYDYSSEDISNIEFNTIDVPSSSSKMDLTINFMNKLFETENNYNKMNYADYIFIQLTKVVKNMNLLVSLIYYRDKMPLYIQII